VPFAASRAGLDFVDLHIEPWEWIALVGFILILLLVDLFVFHREAHEVKPKEAAIESIVWISIGCAFGLLMLVVWGGGAAGEYISAYLIEKSLSVDNVFVWALIFASFQVPPRYQHRVLFWGIFGALVLRAAFIFAGVALIDRFEWILYIFGAFLLYTAGKLMFGGDHQVDPQQSRTMKVIGRFVPTTADYDGQKLFTRVDGKRLATRLFVVLLIVEVTDVLFAVDSVPAVLAVSHEQFIVFASNAFAILGLRALYFLLAGMHARFEYLNEGLAVILAFVGVKMIVAHWWHIPTWFSLVFIALVLVVAVLASAAKSRRAVDPGGGVKASQGSGTAD
jgi:tellurite resistance protein TerC